MAFRSVSTLKAWGAIRKTLGLRELRFGNKKFRAALILIAIGVVGRLLLLNLANVETVLVASLLAGSYLGGIYVLIVPLSIMLSTDAIIYVTRYPGFYPLETIALLPLFVYSGYVLISLMGYATRRRHLAFRLKSIAVLTTISVPLTIFYDVWTATGMWLTIASKPPINLTIWQTYALQVPFTLIHILSSLIFVPIFGTIFLYYLSQPSEVDEPTSAPADETEA
jgi:hypothetical protein